MISSVKIQNNYNRLYAQFRKYIWDYDTIDKLAELEVECYKAIPDTDLVFSIAEKLQREIRDVLEEDEDFEKSFDRFMNYIENADDRNPYLKLYEVKEIPYWQKEIAEREKHRKQNVE